MNTKSWHYRLVHKAVNLGRRPNLPPKPIPTRRGDYLRALMTAPIYIGTYYMVFSAFLAFAILSAASIAFASITLTALTALASLVSKMSVKDTSA